jgi:hypothetical protein
MNISIKKNISIRSKNEANASLGQRYQQSSALNKKNLAISEKRGFEE